MDEHLANEKYQSIGRLRWVEKQNPCPARAQDGGINRLKCQKISSHPLQGRFICKRRECDSPHRICWACVGQRFRHAEDFLVEGDFFLQLLETSDEFNVLLPAVGLCSFHKDNGIEADRFPPSSFDPDEDEVEDGGEGDELSPEPSDDEIERMIKRPRAPRTVNSVKRSYSPRKVSVSTPTHAPACKESAPNPTTSADAWDRLLARLRGSGKKATVVVDTED